MGKILAFRDDTLCDPFDASEEQIMLRLCRAFGYPRGRAWHFAKVIPSLHPSLHEGFRAYWTHKTIDASLSAGGLRLVDLVPLSRDVIQAFFWLNAAHRDPRNATYCYQQALARGRRPRRHGVEILGGGCEAPPPDKLPEW